LPIRARTPGSFRIISAIRGLNIDFESDRHKDTGRDISL
jgi:hypothetical protein